MRKPETEVISPRPKRRREDEESRAGQQNNNTTSPWPLTDDILEQILRFITSHKDRNSVSLVCRSWNLVEAASRQHVYVGNCYAVSASRVAQRFTRLKSLTLKGKPRFADFDLVPRDWGAFVQPWIEILSESHPFLEELRLKRMTLSDECMEMIAESFPNLKVLVLISCDGFSTDGLARITACCRHLTHLQLTENTLENATGDWLDTFNENCTSLTVLDFEDLDHEVDFESLERIVTRCPGLRTLKLNRSVSQKQLQQLIPKAPHLVELGVGSFAATILPEEQAQVCNRLQQCSELRSLSGFWDVVRGYLSFVHPIAPNLVSLNLSYSPICDGELAELVVHCKGLKKLWVMDTVEDKGLQAIASSCKDLRDFRVYPAGSAPGVTEEGLTHLALGCTKLTSILYFCYQMTNAAVEVMARNCSELISFRLCIMDPGKPDHTTNASMDEGFGAIVKHCKELRRLSLSGRLTDKAFEYIGMYGKKLERLSVAFAGESDVGLQHVLRGCINLRKLEIRDSPFGDMGLLSGLHRYESMRSLWMSNCRVTMAGCHWLARQKPRLNVEIIQNKSKDNTLLVESLYVYRSVAGDRKDRPPFVLAF